MSDRWHPTDLLRTRRAVTGMAAVLLPFRDGAVDWRSFTSLLERTLEARLVPAVNMDTGYADLIDAETRKEVLATAFRIAGPGRFVAGAYVRDDPGARFAPDRHRARMEEVQERGGTPVVFPSHGLAGLPEGDLPGAFEDLARGCDRFIAFELGTQFAPFGRIFDLDTYRSLLELDACIGAKHSSLDRMAEWKRLELRDEVRPDFLVLTGNDLAIDMVTYGSDYLLGLAAFAPDVFARRDFAWEIGHPEFYELNDRLQYLGCFAFRPPIPAYKHSAAQFLHLRGWISSPEPHPGALRRPASDLEVLAAIAADLGLVER